jgi:hypothetical protein
MGKIQKTKIFQSEWGKIEESLPTHARGEKRYSLQFMDDDIEVWNDIPLEHLENFSDFLVSTLKEIKNG